MLSNDQQDEKNNRGGCGNSRDKGIQRGIQGTMMQTPILNVIIVENQAI